MLGCSHGSWRSRLLGTFGRELERKRGEEESSRRKENERRTEKDEDKNGKGRKMEEGR
jgi:hypothetical protein